MMDHKHGRLRTLLMLAAVLLGFIGVPVGLAPRLTDSQSNDVKAAGVVPAPPSSGPSGRKLLYQWLHAAAG